MSIRICNGVLESLLCAIMLRKMDGQNRARNVQEQSHVLRMKHTNMLELNIEQNDVEGEHGS